jgi:trehalose synthase
MVLRLTYPEVNVEKYFPLLAPQLVEDLTAAARELQHLRFVHINSTATGGGVAEILQSLVPLMNSLGVVTERLVINPPPPFFQVTKRIHNFLQGADGALAPEELDFYFNTIREVAHDIREKSLEADVWFFHDPQLLPLASMLPKQTNETRLWVCHIDLTRPNQNVMDSLLPLTKAYDGLVFSLDSYVPSGLDENVPVYIVPPAIDPLTLKNIPLNEIEASKIIVAMGVDPHRPLITQVSRFDVWKDPLGVIDAYRLARQSVPGLQLALLGLSQAIDDPEALQVLDQVTRYAGGDPDIHLYFYPSGLPDTIDNIVNAFQVASQIVLQKSIREGFGLTVAEAMWKGRPVIGGDVGGVRIQIKDGVNGYLVNSPAECAQRIVELLNDPGLRSRIGEAARNNVRDNYLLPRLASDYLQAVKALLPELANKAGVNGNGAKIFDNLEKLQASPPFKNGSTHDHIWTLTRKEQRVK